MFQNAVELGPLSKEELPVALLALMLKHIVGMDFIESVVSERIRKNSQIMNNVRIVVFRHIQGRKGGPFRPPSDSDFSGRVRTAPDQKLH